MGSQEDIFLDSEGDAWFTRNWLKMGQGVDPVQEIIRENGVIRGQKRILEFGCANAWRLASIRSEYSISVQCFGIDPSQASVANAHARFKNVAVGRGTVLAHPHSTETMDVVIYGFCLYVCDREDLFEIASQGHNVLRDHGYLIIHDFDPEFPHAVPNHHVDGLMTYKMDYSKLWLANPAYTLVAKKALPDETAVWLLRKDVKKGWPQC